MCRGRMKLGALAAIASFVVAGYAAAQETGQRLRERQLDRSGVQTQSERSATTEQPQTEERRAGYRGAGQAGQSQKLDKYLASCLLIKNQAEVEFSKFGEQQTQNPQVKQFAQMLVEDHQQMIPKLEQIAGQQAGRQSDRQRVGAAGQSDAQRTTQDADEQRTAQNATTRSDQAYASEGGEITQQLQDIDRQITQRCLEMTKEKLQEKQGAEFDKAFVGCQIGKHIDSLAALEVIQQQSSGQLAQVAGQAAKTVQQHLEQAEQLMQQLEGQQGRQSQQTRTQR